MNALIHPIEAGCEIIPTEVLETRMPIRKRRFELMTDSGGPGEFRGGLSATAEFEFLGPGLSTSVVERSRASQARGVAGGDPAPFQNRMILFPGTPKELQLGKKPDVPVVAGDICVSRPSGGGGWGLAVERDPATVLDDVRNGYVSREKAEEAYGVVFDTEDHVDEVRTSQLRSKLKRQGAQLAASSVEVRPEAS
jgi:N-methylhydantoinase B